MFHKISLLFVFLLMSWLGIQAQEKNTPDISAQEIEAYKNQCGQMIRFLEGTLNFLGNPENMTSEKEIIINNSYLKVFKSPKVQIEDDLDENREMSMRKDVQAYLKDVVFFYKKVNFSFSINHIDPGVDEQGEIYFKVELNRTLNGITVTGDTVENNQLRYIEINVDAGSNGLKIASIYTNKPNESAELQYWWNHLSQAWKDYFGKSILVYDSIPMNKIQSYNDTGLIINYQQTTVTDPITHYIKGDSLIPDSSQLINPDSLNLPLADTLSLNTHLLSQIIKQLRKTRKIDISGNLNILDLDALRDWPELNSLRCAHTLINDLSPLRNLNKLEVLDITGCPISSLNPLIFVSDLREIDAAFTPLKNIGIISNLKKLETLNLGNTLIDTLPGFEQLQHLRTLELNNTPFHRIDSLASLSKLVNLNLSRCILDDFSPLNALRKLQILNLDSTNITDLKALDSLKSLIILQVNGTRIHNLLPLSHLSNLKYIYCDYSGIHLEQSEAFNALQPHCQVIFNSEKLENWWAGLNDVWKKVFRSYTNLSDPVTKEQLHSLLQQKSIDISQNLQIHSLEALSFMTQIKALNLSGTSVKSLIPLSNMGNLRELNANNTGINDLSPLSKLNNLKQISIENTGVSDLLPLTGNSNLSIIYADGSKVTDKQAEALRRHLPNCLVIYQTARLHSWWQKLNKNWKQVFSEQITMDEPPTKEQLQKLVNLKKVSIRNQLQLSNLIPLSVFTRLKEVYLDNTAVSDITPLFHFTKLECLSVRNSPLANIQGIEKLHELKKLDFENTSVDNLDAIQNLNRLRSLNIAGTKIKNLKPLEHLFWLEELYINNTRISNIKILKTLNHLKLLRCNNSGLKAKKVEAFTKIHPHTKVIFY